MDSEKVQNLREWAKEYNNLKYFQEDPIQLPRKFTRKQDIEIAGFLAAWISQGNRKQIYATTEKLYQLIGDHPYDFIQQGDFSSLRGNLHATEKRDTLYRFYTYDDLRQVCGKLRYIYSQYDCLEEALNGGKPCPNPIKSLREMFNGIRGIPVPDSKSACKRLAMFLRWMVRRDGIVDLGIWKDAVQPQQLLIPLDTHVYQIAHDKDKLNITRGRNHTWNTAKEITEAMAEVFPDDPCLGDFALFGYDINNRK